MSTRTRQIETDERSGVLEPANLLRFSAEWVEPAREVRDVVDTYWAVRWDLPPGESVAQRIIDFPAVTFSIESGNVPAPFVVTAVQRRAWTRIIAGRGSVFAIRLRPAGLAVLSDLDPATLDREQVLTPETDLRAYHLLDLVREKQSSAERAHRADDLIGALLRERPLRPVQTLANVAVDMLTARVHVTTGKTIADEIGTSERSIQRALRSTLGMGPNAIARRIRLQEVARLFSLPDADISRIAADLGYVDQAHLINDFRGVAGVTPGQYVRELRRSQNELRGE